MRVADPRDVEIKAMLLADDDSVRQSAVRLVSQRYAEGVKGYLARYCPWLRNDEQEIEALMNDALLQVVLTITVYDPLRCNIGTWWSGRARFLALQELDESRPRGLSELSFGALAELPDEGQPSQLERLAAMEIDEGASYGEETTRRHEEQRRMLGLALASLHPVDMVVLQAVLDDRYDVQALARQLGKTAGRIRNAKSRAIPILKKALIRLGYGSEVVENLQ